MAAGIAALLIGIFHSKARVFIIEVGAAELQEMGLAAVAVCMGIFLASFAEWLSSIRFEANVENMLSKAMAHHVATWMYSTTMLTLSNNWLRSSEDEHRIDGRSALVI